MTTYLDDISSSCEGYFFLSQLSNGALKKVNRIQDDLRSFFDDSEVYLIDGKQLHVTIAHLISPDVIYDDDPTELYEGLKHQATEAAQKITSGERPFDVKFKSLRVFNDAGVIILQAENNNSMSQLRSRLAESIPTPDGTRKPPAIIHTSILRFRTCRDIDGLNDYIEKFSGQIKVTIGRILLVRETRLFTQDYDVLAEYALKEGSR